MRTSPGSIWPGVPLLVWLAILLTALFGWMARSTRIGRNLYALGSSPESARLVGINETWHIAFVFILSGLLCGLVGVLWGARFGTVDAVLAPDLHLQAISAVVIGGVSIFGGSGSVYGAAIGAVIFAVLQNGVQLLGVNQFWLEAVIGAAILGTVMFYSLLARRRRAGGAATRGPAPALAAPARSGGELTMTRLRGLVARWELFLLARPDRHLRLRQPVLRVLPDRVEHLDRHRRRRAGGDRRARHDAGHRDRGDRRLGRIERRAVRGIARGRDRAGAADRGGDGWPRWSPARWPALFNGIIVAYAGLPSLVVTLGTLALYRGTALIMLKERGVHSFPEWYQNLGIRDDRRARPVPWSSIIFMRPVHRVRGVPARHALGPGALRDRQQPGGRAASQASTSGAPSSACSWPRA